MITDLELTQQTILRVLKNPKSIVKNTKLKHTPISFYSFILIDDNIKEYNNTSVDDYTSMISCATECRMIDNHRQLLFMGNASIPYYLFVQA